jgi:HEAT repeat protein
MAEQDASLIERLCQAESPWDMDEWEGKDGYYVAACRVSVDDVPRLIDIARWWHVKDPLGADDFDVDPDDAQMLPITAWRTLADLKADAAVEPLIELLRESSDEFDDWLLEDLPHVFGKIGESAVEPLIRLVRDAVVKEFARSAGVRSLRLVADHDASTRDRVVAFLTEMMTNAAKEDIEFNSTVLVELVELQAVEAAESIERAFAGNCLDVGMMGDWEVVRKALGVQGLGLAMPENPENSITDLRSRLGIGIFSDLPIFLHGEVDLEAKNAYCQRAWDVFSNSIEAERIVARYGGISWFNSLLDFGLEYCGATVDELTLDSVQEFVLEHLPRKFSTEPDTAEEIVEELTAFWEYLGRVYELREANSIVQWLKADGRIAKLKRDLADPSNYGMAKSIFMQGKLAGYDMTSELEVAEFMAAYNQSLAAEREAGSAQQSAIAHIVPRRPLTRENDKVGRNDPCPCGSGKKFKKCCGHA